MRWIFLRSERFCIFVLIIQLSEIIAVEIVAVTSTNNSGNSNSNDMLSALHPTLSVGSPNITMR